MRISNRAVHNFCDIEFFLKFIEITFIPRGYLLSLVVYVYFSLLFAPSFTHLRSTDYWLDEAENRKTEKPRYLGLYVF